MSRTSIKFLLLFLVLFMTVSINLPGGMIARIGLDPGYLLAALVAIAVAGMVIHRHILLVLLVVLLTIGANLPEGASASLGIDRDYLIATLVGIVVLPLFIDS